MARVCAAACEVTSSAARTRWRVRSIRQENSILPCRRGTVQPKRSQPLDLGKFCHPRAVAADRGPHLFDDPGLDEAQMPAALAIVQTAIASAAPAMPSMT